MAESPSHKFGQLIGNLLEELIAPPLKEFAKQNGLFLDHQKISRPARKGKKVTWQDQYGNLHDLDYVLEQHGTLSAKHCRRACSNCCRQQPCGCVSLCC